MQREYPCKGPHFQPFSSPDPLWNFVIAFAVLPLLPVGTAERLRRYEMSFVPGSSGLLPLPLSTAVALCANGGERWRVLAGRGCSGCLNTALKHLKKLSNSRVASQVISCSAGERGTSFISTRAKPVAVRAGFPGTARGAGRLCAQLVEFVVIFKQPKSSSLGFAVLFRCCPYPRDVLF